MAFIDEGDPAARPVLLLSGNPTWGFLYRDFVEPLKAAGFRVIAPDWIGAGYSDHPRVDSALTLAHHFCPSAFCRFSRNSARCGANRTAASNSRSASSFRRSPR
ncbi:MAG: alpha/beta fold hydrolase [Blastocatellia bacterium]